MNEKPLREIIDGLPDPDCIGDKHGECDGCELARRVRALDEYMESHKGWFPPLYVAVRRLLDGEVR